MPHLSYIGDADIGAGTNIGAGNITANYHAGKKHRTTIGAHVHTGSDNVFVAPVTIGDDAPHRRRIDHHRRRARGGARAWPARAR